MSKNKLKKIIIRLLPEISIFGGLNKEEVEFFIENLIEERYTAKEIIFEEENKSGNSYLLLDGTVKLTMAGIEIAYLKPGMSFGTASPIGIQKQIVTATADTDVIVAAIPKMALYHLEKQNSKLFEKIILNEARDLARHLKLMKEIILNNREQVNFIVPKKIK